MTARRPGTYWLRFWSALAVLLVWILLVLRDPGFSPSQLGIRLLYALGVIALGFSMLAGVFLAADTLAEEKREGTIGLLFLTDLRSYDVVLGKLAACSLQAFFGLLAALPILGLTLLLGGVTGREFARLVLVFCATLFFSLGIGMFVSAVSHDARQAMARTILLVVLFAGICPAIWWAQRIAQGRSASVLALLPSPAFTFSMAFDSRYAFGRGAHEFWWSLGTVFSLGLAGVVLACLLLPRVWQRQEVSSTTATKRRGRPSSVNRETGARRKALLDWNPIFWLTARDAAPQRAAVRTLLFLLPVWLCFVFWNMTASRRREEPFIISMFIAFGLHLLIKVQMAVEASRRMNLDRQSGALELLLVTPVRVESILEGQMKALWRHFRVPMLLLALVNVGLGISVGAQSLHMNSTDLAIFWELYLGGVVALICDFRALGWVGMWRGLNDAKHHRAVLGTLGGVLGVPWLALFLMVFMVRGFHSAGGAAMTFAGWFALGVMIDLVAARSARQKLMTEFRAMAAQRFGGKGG